MSGATDIAVVGAGVFGAWTAEHLRRAGQRVTLVDMAGPGHERSSSGDESRLTRAAYGPDELYSRMAIASLPEWQGLSAGAGLPLFHRCGILFLFADGGEPYLGETVAVHARLGLPSQRLDAAEVAARFPMIDVAGLAAGLFEPGFGALMARRAVQTLVAGFVARGGTYRQAKVATPLPDAPLDALPLADGGRLEAERFVIAAGAWLPALLPDLLGPRITPTRQEVFYFAPPPGDPRFQPGAMPGWCDFNGGDMIYGLPDLEGRGVKIAHDRHGPPVDPDTQSRLPSPDAIAAAIAYRDRRFSALRGAPLVGARVCQYENSATGDLLIDRHPAFSNVVLVGGGSGHGFKHGPEVGRIAAQLVLSDGPQPEPRLSLATKGTGRRRAVH